MKILKISKEEMEAKFEYRIGALIIVDNQDEIRRRLLDAGFDMTRVFHQGRDKEGNRLYVQKEHEAESVNEAFGRE